MKLEILQYPHSALTTRSTPYAFNRSEAEALELEQNMFDTIIAADGLGLAANQIGITERFIAMRLVSNDQFLMLYNPEVVGVSEELFEQSEGCLSFPQTRLAIHRPNIATVKFQDRNGNQQERTFVGWDAKCVQHECEHLDGIVIKDHVDEATYTEAVELGKTMTTKFTTRSQLKK